MRIPVGDELENRRHLGSAVELDESMLQQPATEQDEASHLGDADLDDMKCEATRGHWRGRGARGGHGGVGWGVGQWGDKASHLEDTQVPGHLGGTMGKARGHTHSETRMLPHRHTAIY